MHFRHADRRGRAEVARAFGCPVAFGQPDDRLRFPVSRLRAVSHYANPLIAEQIEKFATALSAQMTPGTTLRERVSDVTRMLLTAGLRPAGTAVARRLGVSTRSLQRGLEDEHTNFRVVRDAVLWELVEALLSNPSIKIEAVALSVGFGDAAAFSKVSSAGPGARRSSIARGSPLGGGTLFKGGSP